MSNATQNPGKTGQSRRRRSRGGQNRRNNDTSEQNNQFAKQNRKEAEHRHKGNGKSRYRKMPKPVPLSLWQRLLKAIGLYKDPVRPPRPDRRPEKQKSNDSRKEKIRDARSSSEGTNSQQQRSRHPKRQKTEGETNYSKGGDVSTVENCRVYVGNLSYDTTESDLEDLFKGVGAVRRVEIVYNRHTHRSKGYGFIEMLDIDEAKRTVEVLHDQFFMGRKLTVSGAKSQDYKKAEEAEGTNSEQNFPKLAPLHTTETLQQEAVASEQLVTEISAVASPDSEKEKKPILPA